MHQDDTYVMRILLELNYYKANQSEVDKMHQKQKNMKKTITHFGFKSIFLFC